MDYGISFTYLFKDDNWITKVLIGVVVNLIPVINLAGVGYVLEVVKNVRDGASQPLPEWDNFGDLFINGLKFFLGAMLYALPAIFVTFLMLPVGMIAGDDPGAFLTLTLVTFTCFITLFSLLPLLLMPVLMVQYARRDEIKDMFAFADMWEMIKSDIATYLIILLFMVFVLSFVAGIGFIACGIGAFFTGWYAYLVAGHITGQYAERQPGIEKSV